MYESDVIKWNGIVFLFLRLKKFPLENSRP